MSKSDANIKVGADTTAFSKAIDGLEKGITEKLEKIGNVFMGALGLGAAAKSIAGAFSAFTEPAAELENVATSLGVVMGNAEAAERLTSSLQRMATNGVVGMDDLHASARALSNVFQDDAVIAHYVGRLADLAAGSKIPAARLGELVARMEDMGKAELTELSNAGIPIVEALASVLGKSTEEVVKMSGAGKTMRDAREQEKAKRLPYATSGRVVKVAKKPHDTQDGEVYCVQVDFEEYGALWVRSNDMIVTEKATPASRPGVGEKVTAKRMAPVFSSKEDLGRMITMAARNNETATAFLLERASRGHAFILEAGEEVAIIDIDGWLEPYYLVQRMSDNRTGWVLCVAFE